MDVDTVVEIGRQAIYVTMLVVSPILLAALLIGLLIGVFQAATQIQEMTLSFVPKLLGMALIIALAAPWLITQLTEFARDLIERIPTLVN